VRAEGFTENIYSTVVICHARTPMLPLGQAEYPDQKEGVCNGTPHS
jgi:hypothetical protein